MRIGVAIDGSENALRAAQHAISIIHYLPNAVLDIIFVVDFNKVKDDSLLAQNLESLTLIREQKTRPVLNLAEEANVQAKVHLLKGQPSEEIINFVNDNTLDQLIIGSRGLNTFQEMVLGSVSHKVMKHVKCPVTIVK